MRLLATLLRSENLSQVLGCMRGFEAYQSTGGCCGLALFNCRFLSDSCIHLPQVQYTMPTSWYNEQSGHCILEEVSQSSKYSVLPMLLNGLNSSVLFKSSINESRCG